MEIILKQYVKGLGEKNDIVTVRNGYARNFLIPQGLAMLATESAKKVIAENVKQAQHRLAHQRSEFEKIAEKIQSTTIRIEALAGADGKLYGSVTPLMVETRLRELGFEVDRRRISFDSDIRDVGTYTATLDLHKEVKAKITIEVVAADR